MGGSALLIICSLVYIITLFIVYRSKQHIATIEHKIFSFLIKANICGLVLELLNYFFVLKYKESLLTYVVSKLYLLYLLTFIIFFTYYVFYISFEDTRYKDKIDDIRAKVIKWGGFIFYILLFLVAMLPIEFCNDSGIYSYGPSPNIIYVVSLICILICTICAFVNIKNIRHKKYFPLFSFFILGIISIGIQKYNPGLTLITSVETFIIYIMYFTIENPDVKMIKQLNLARNQAEKANAAKTDFLSNMSHEIRTPLNAIVSFSNLLLENKDLPSNAKDEVKDIITASDNLLEIVNGILDISKIEANKIEIINNEYSFKKLCYELISLTKGRLGDKPVEFKYKIDESIPPVLYGDVQRVKQVCVNILTNAVKYTKKGSIELVISSVIKNNVCRLIISVEDTGIGIKPENINKLFNKFERIDIEENITIEGTGLGLAITKMLLDLMKGKIVVQSVYGKGSKFTVSIDQRIVKNPKLVEEDIVEDQITVNKVNNKKILVVDDNKINLKVAEKLLSNYGVETELLESGFACIDALKNKNKYDLILLDDMMPRMSGVETLQKIKAEIKDFDIPIVALTANALTGMKEKYLEAGFDDYLSKPIDKKELNRIINKYLNKN